ncbi:inositol monophosphatase [Mycolicibacterium agri]|nr:inositol monophosphatase [Mycolicibacterium agri]
MVTTNYCPEVKLATKLAQQMVEIVDDEVASYRDSGFVESKDERDIVTSADQAIEMRLRRELKTIDPSSHILGEEDAERSPTARSFKRQWVIDPIDGTINFARDIDIYTSTASLIDNGKPTIAVVYQPWPRTITIAVRGHGCWRWDGVIGAECNLSGIKLTTQTTRWSKSLHALMLTPKISENSRLATLRLTEMLLSQTLGIRVFVSQAYESTMLASGSIDAVLTLSSSDEWTKGASRLICEEAGGLFAIIQRESEGDENEGFGLFASTPVYKRIAGLLRTVGYSARLEK